MTVQNGRRWPQARSRAFFAGVCLVVLARCGENPRALTTADRPSPTTTSTLAKVTLTPAAPTLAVGATVTFTVTGYDAAGNVLPGPITCGWASDQPAVATVSAGVARGVSVGKSLIKAGCGGIIGSATVTVVAAPVAVASVTITPASGSVTVGHTLQLTAAARDSAGNVLAGRGVTWTTNAPAIALVDSTGLVTAWAAGSATISAVVDGTSASAAITVTPVLAASVAVSPSSASVTLGQTVRLIATARDSAGTALNRPITWSSSAPAVATVDTTGLVSTLATGSVTITATADGQSASAAVTITPVLAASVTVTPATATLSAGQTAQLTATARDSAGNVLTRPITWSSSAPTVATVSATGLVSALAAGSATITATADGRSGSATVTVPVVVGPLAKVVLTPASATIAVGGSVTFTVTGYDAQGHVEPGPIACGWSSDQPAIATVSGGVAKGVAAGSSLIKAGCGGIVGSATVTVTSSATSSGPVAATVTVSPASASLQVGGTQQLTATARDSAGNVLSHPVTWSSSAPAVASVGASGLVSALAAGSATVTATVDGKSAGAAITVVASGTAPAPTAWPNDEPSGLTQLLAANGSTKYYFAPNANVVVGARWSDATLYAAANNGTRVQVVSDAASKFGTVVRKWTFAGEQSGFNGEYDWQGAPGFGDVNGYRQLYVRMVFRFDPNWQWEVAHTQKLFYFATNRTNQGGGGNANSFFVSVDRGQIDFVDQANPTAASTTANGDGNQYNADYRYTPPAGMIAAGQYITVELWIRANSSPTTADGQARLWVNGTEITPYMAALNGAYAGQKGLSNRIWCGDTKFFDTSTGFNANFNNMQTLLYWGGSGDTAASNFYFDLNELYISGVGA